MDKKKILIRSLPLALIVLLPFLLGWEKVNLQEFFKAQSLIQSQAAQGQAKLQPPNLLFPDITPYKILEKATSAVYRTKSMHVDTEAWFENPAYHIKSHFNNDIIDMDNYRTNGRVSVSMFYPYSFSTSNWVQSYQIRGVPFTWDLNKREWRQEELKISARDAKKVLGYSLLSSLFTVNEGSVDPATVIFLGLETRNGRNCFLLQYKLDPKFFKRWNLAGEISVKTWIDSRDFLPQMLRAEGKIGDIYILQIANYSGYNSEIELSVPAVITEKADKEKEALKNKVGELSDAVCKIMGWYSSEKINVEFKGRLAFGQYLDKQIQRDYTPENLAQDEFIFKWLGLLHKDADYKESIFNSEISSIGGLYDPKKKTIFMGDWIPPSYSELILVHEIAHAFQDRTFDLEKFTGGQDYKDNFDLIFARKSVAEGEATAIMLEYLLNSEGKSFKDLEDIFSLIEEKLLKNSPYVRQDVLYNIYGFGTNFIQANLRQGNWPDLDNIFKMPPVSMKEIIHPYKYIGKAETGAINKEQKEPKDPAFEIKMPQPWKAVYSARLGEFFLLMSLRQSLDRDSAEKASSGLQKDRIFVFENKDGRRVVYFVTRWDRESDATEYAGAYSEWLKKRYPQVTSEESGGRKFFDTAEKEMFSCMSGNNLVKIIWAKDMSREEFLSLANNIYSIAK